MPCVFIENRRVVGLDPRDPIQVSYKTPVGTDPTGRDHPELLKMRTTAGHDQTIVNGISRIGYMSGGNAARWVDEDIADTLVRKGTSFIERHQKQPFFLYFATHDIHVPRVPHPRFVGKSGMGPRGDAILQFDWSVGEVLKTLDRLKLTDNTLVVFTSDNGPVLDDGYADEAVEKVGPHKPAGPLRGGKYSAFDAGTRVPFVARWPEGVRRGVSGALLSQIDLIATFAALTAQPLGAADAPDSFEMLGPLRGTTNTGRDHLVEQGAALSLIAGPWKYIEPSNGPAIERSTNIELGHSPDPQLYNLDDDIGETRNLAAQFPQRVSQMADRLKTIRAGTRTR